MVRTSIVVMTVMCVVSANPIWVRVINEFQVSPDYQEKLELRLLYSESFDTLQCYDDSVSLLDMIVETPAGSAYVDTNIMFHFNEPTVLDRSMMSGYFDMPDYGATVWLYHYFWYLDSIKYPGQQPNPPAYWSASRFYCFGYDSTWYPPWFFIDDWYLDSTPTFGAPNDDYPGCVVAGHVYDHLGQPLEACIVTARSRWYEIYGPPYLFKCCTTYTDSSGTYGFTHLLPWYYTIDAAADGYLPDTLSIGPLYALEPMNDLDFYLDLGVKEYDYESINDPAFYPNPVATHLYVRRIQSSVTINMYDISGQLCKSIKVNKGQNAVEMDCRDLSPGIYFVTFGNHTHKIIKL